MKTEKRTNDISDVHDDREAKERRFMKIFIISACLYIVVCAVVFAAVDISRRNSYVHVTPIVNEGEVIPESEKISINTATAEELMTINGIGEVTAAKIIEYREKFGGFLSIDELVEVNGIGEKTLDLMRPYLKM
ncbi:MAG: helix-hairpin-helix domain-containing protein [Ruminiclostridium sp.]|nr:helix-hairpin-helix domain-containing protein [Ruminiclostridium sp.]